MIDIYKMVGGFFPSQDIYQKWLDGNIIIVHGVRHFHFINRDNLPQIRQWRREEGMIKTAKRLGVSPMALKSILYIGDK